MAKLIGGTSEEGERLCCVIQGRGPVGTRSDMEAGTVMANEESHGVCCSISFTEARCRGVEFASAALRPASPTVGGDN